MPPSAPLDAPAGAQGGDLAVRWVECPRDAWQALPAPIPTDRKRAHLRALIDAGFGWLDMGSFVSPRHVPQLADTEAVLRGMAPPENGSSGEGEGDPVGGGAVGGGAFGGPARDPGPSELLAIVGNERGLERARATRAAALRGEGRGVDAVGYPLSVDDTFQRRNLGRSLAASWEPLDRLHRAARESGLQFVVYLSMAFGNPYGEPWSPAATARVLERVRELGVERVALADTVGRADAATVGAVLDACDEPAALGLHLHARPDGWEPLLSDALERGVRWFEGAFAGQGGCPFAADDLVGNLPTERVLAWLARRGFALRDPAGELRAIPEPEVLERRARAAANLAAEYGAA